MSTLKTSNIQDTSGNNNSTPAEISNGRAKAWVYFEGDATNVSNTANGYNVSSITDHGPGDYTVVFTTAMANANYAVAISAKLNGGQSNIPIPHWNSGGPATNSFRFQLSEAASYSTTRDSADVCFVVFGD